MECQVCGSRVARYRCPACDKRTCSVPCVRLHKLRDNCTGSLHARYIPKSRVDLLSDATFLDSAPLPSDVEDGTAGGTREGMGKLVAACRQRGIVLLAMPEVFKKAAENESRMVGDTIMWTVRVDDRLRVMSEDDNVVAVVQSGCGVEIKCDKPTRWKALTPGDTIRTALQGETIVEFPELRTIKQSPL